MEGERTSVNSELWHACAGPCVNLPSVGSLVVYFPQGHSEQVAASTLKEVDSHIPNYPNVQSQLVCQLHNIALHADLETDEVFAQMTLQPVNEQEKDLLMAPDIGTPNRQPTDFFCKTLTASDTSTHGGFSVPRRAAEKIFPTLDFNKQPPAQELRARDLHDNVWTFRHIYRGQPKRHLLTTGWSVFVSAKRLIARDSVMFIRDDKGQLLLGIRRATSRQQSVMPSSVLSSDSMHIGVLAAAAHAAATSSRFQVFYNPRTSPSEFVIPLSKYRKSVHFTQVSVGMRFRMVFETEESTLRRYMGTVTGIGDLNPNRWPGSKWRSVEVGWDESSASERPRRVSLWEIEPVSTPILICPPHFALRPKRPLHNGDESDIDGSIQTWLRGENGSIVQGLGAGGSSWIQFQQRPDPERSDMYDTFAAAAHQDFRTTDVPQALNLQGQLRSLQQRQQSFNQQEVNQQSQVIWPHSNNGHQVFQNHQIHNQPQLPSLVSLPSSSASRVESQLPHTQPTSLAQSRTSLHLPSTQHLYTPELQQQHQVQTVLQMQLHHSGQAQAASYTQQILPQISQRSVMSHPNQPLSHSNKPVSHSNQPVSHSNQPASHSNQSVSHSNQSVSHSNQPVSHSNQPVSHPNQPVPHMNQCAPHTNQSVSLTNQSTPHAKQSVPHTNQSFPLIQLPTTHMNEIPLSVSQMLSSRAQPSIHVGAVKQFTTGVSEADVTFSVQGSHGKTPVGGFGSNDNGQLSNILRTNQSMVQLPHQQQHQNFIQHHHATAHKQKQLPPQSQPQPQQLSQLHHTSQELQIETPLSGNWFSLPRETTQCESPIGSNIQVSHSDMLHSASMSHSYSLPVEILDNPSVLPPISASLQTRFDSTNKELQTQQGLNEAIMGPFSSPNGLITATTPDEVCGNPEIMTSGVFDEVVLQRTSSNNWSQVPCPAARTFTKVHKAGSVGRSVDLSRLKSYDMLRQELARMFNIEGQLEDPQRSYWKLVFVDNVGDILLVGDDPWDEFISCVRAIKILSTAQVLQMNQGLPIQQQTSSSSEDCHVWKDT